MSNLVLMVSSFLSVACLVLVAVSFATDRWIETIVDRAAIVADASVDQTILNTDPRYHKSYRGLFRTCYPGNDTSC